MSEVPIWRFGDALEPLHEHLDRGGLLAIPTESSYGLGADPHNPQGVAAVYRVKRRVARKPLPVVVADRRQLADLGGELTEPVLAALAGAWPAPLSLLVPVRTPLAAAAGQPRVAVRVPAHAGLRSLLAALGRPLTATSANLSGEPPLLTPEAAAELLTGYDARVVDGGTLSGGPPSTVVALEEGEVRILRPGRVAAAGATAQEASQPTGEILPLEAVEAGQRGYGLSVFQGSEPERFEVEVLGVLRNQAPDQSYILARLSGRDLESTGVIAGMSGSPVYLNGRLAGAVAFSWPFADEPVAGITPIESMMGLAAGPPSTLPAAAATAAPDVRRLLEPAGDAEVLVAALHRLQQGTADGRVTGVEWVGRGFSGVSRSLLERGLGAVTPAGSAAPQTVPSALVPGSSVAGLLVDGDLRLAATGTVTERLDDGRLLAFGHPLLGLGPIRVPMATAEVVTVLNSQLSSFKIANVGEVVGAFDLDRLPGVRGQVGLEAPVLPLTVTVHHGQTHSFDLRVARIPTLTPTLLAIATLGSFDSAAHAAGEQGIDLDLRVRLSGYPDVRLQQSFDGPQAAMETALYVLAVAAFLEQNPWAELGLEEVRVELTQNPDVRSAELIGAYASRTRVRPGDTVQLTAELRAWRGGVERRSVPITVPRGLPAGRYHLLVGDGPAIDGARLAVERAGPIRIEQALELLQSLHSRRQLVVLGLFSDRGLSVAGEPLPQLPGSLQSLWAASSSGSAVPLQLAVAQQQVLELDTPMRGTSRVTLEVRRRQPLGGEAEERETAEEKNGEGESQDRERGDERGETRAPEPRAATDGGA